MPPVETVDNVPAQPAMNNLLGPEVRGGISLVDGVRERLVGHIENGFEFGMVSLFAPF